MCIRDRANASKAEKMAAAHEEEKEGEAEAAREEPEIEKNREKEKGKEQEKGAKTRGRGRNSSRQEAKPKVENKANEKAEAKPEKEKSREKAVPESQEEKTPQPRTNLEMVRQAIHSIVQDGSDEDGWMLSADLGNQLAKRFPDFDVRNFGFSKLTPFLASLRDFEIRRTRSSGNRNVQLVYVKEK